MIVRILEDIVVIEDIVRILQDVFVIRISHDGLMDVMVWSGTEI